VAYLPNYAGMISKIPLLPALLNLRNHIKPIAKLQEWIMGISAQRSLPTWRGINFWSNYESISPYQYGPETLAAKKGVVLLADTFNAYFEDENLKAAIRVLQAAGYAIHIPHKIPTKARAPERPNSKARVQKSFVAAERIWRQVWSIKPKKLWAN
jgi:hypothetical protein